jgi:hypothetical protein
MMKQRRTSLKAPLPPIDKERLNTKVLSCSTQFIRITISPSDALLETCHFPSIVGIAMKELKLPVPEIKLIVMTRFALGVGIGLLLSTRLNSDQHKAAGLALT